MTALTFTRTLSGLAPTDDAATRRLQRIPLGNTVQVTVASQRRHKSLARWWVLCGLIYQNSDQFGSAEQVSDLLKIMSGHCSTIVSKATGEIYLIPKSISFAAIPEDEFQEIWLRAIKAVCTDIIPGLEEQAVQDECYRLVGAMG